MKSDARAKESSWEVLVSCWVSTLKKQVENLNRDRSIDFGKFFWDTKWEKVKRFLMRDPGIWWVSTVKDLVEHLNRDRWIDFENNFGQTWRESRKTSSSV